jgi:hypothetical protein
MSHRFRIAAPIAALALAAFAAGCGSDDNGTSSSTASSPTASTSSVSSGAATTGDTGAGAATATQPGGAAPAGSPTLEDVLSGIHSVLLNQGLDPSVAKCVEDNLRDSLTEEDVKDASANGPSAAFRQKIAAAAQACSPGGQ